MSAPEPRLGATYEAGRTASLDALSAAQEHRRVQLGELFAVVFVDAGTLHAAVEESLRARRVGDPGLATAESAAAAELLPLSGGVAAVVLVDAADPAALADRLAAMGEDPPALHLEIAGRRLTARPSAPAAAMPVVFEVGEAEGAALRAGATVALVLEHPAGAARAELTGRQREALVELSGA
ncbi:MAG: DUF3501 family protein [Candidatus Dormibacteria bacterium]